MSNIRTITVNNVTYDVADDWVATETVASGTPNTITFSSIDDTTSYGYDVYIDVTSASTNKAPYAKLSSISGSGTSSMTLVYQTDADVGATAKLRRIK